jgi:hypothetical protein
MMCKAKQLHAFSPLSIIGRKRSRPLPAWRQVWVLCQPPS